MNNKLFFIFLIIIIVSCLLSELFLFKENYKENFDDKQETKIINFLNKPGNFLTKKKLFGKWTNVTESLPLMIYINNDTIYGLSDNNLVFTTSIKGGSWMQKTKVQQKLKSFKVKDDIIYGINDKNIMVKSSINSNTWESINPNTQANTMIFDFDIYNSNVYGIGVGNTIIRLNLVDGGNWNLHAPGPMRIIKIYNNEIYCIGIDNFIYYRKIDALITEKWKLLRNFPTNYIYADEKYLYALSNNKIYRLSLIEKNITKWELLIENANIKNNKFIAYYNFIYGIVNNKVYKYPTNIDEL